MFKHHADSIENLINYFDGDPDVLAVILGGSVAKGCERADSDLDVMVTVTDHRYAALAKQNKLADCVFGQCTYEGGYFDIKYNTKDFLKAVAAHGSEPARNAFVNARCLTCRDAEITEIIPKIGVFQQQEKEEKILAFFSAMHLNYCYFFPIAKDDLYLKIRSAADIVLFGGRLLLQEAEVLFPCHKGLMAAVENLSCKPDSISNKANRLLSELTDEAMQDYKNAVLNFISFKPGPPFEQYCT
ncbi:MAG: nucleotidyltransferase domain-containing protein, partial [Defluviitaleaceae bacterium]|nr:nucleotidyltransferase domain-containing protein [Defluviitaleaceae bacterium]